MSTASAPLMPQQVRVVAQTAYLGDDQGRVVRTITVPGDPVEVRDRWERLRSAQPALRVHIENDGGTLVQRVGQAAPDGAASLCSMTVVSADERSTRVRLAIHHSLADAHSWSIIEAALRHAEIARLSIDDYAQAVDRVNKRFADAASDDPSAWDDVVRAIRDDPFPSRTPGGAGVAVSTDIDATEWIAVSRSLGVGTTATAIAGTVRALGSVGRRSPVIGVAVTLRDVAGFELVGDFVEVVPLVVHHDQQLERQLQQRLIDLHRVKWSWPAVFAAEPDLRRAAFDGRLHDITVSILESPAGVVRSEATPAVPHLQFDVAGRLDIVAPERDTSLANQLIRQIPKEILGRAGRPEHELLLRRLIAAQVGHDVAPEDDLLAAGLTSLGMMHVAEEAVRHGLPVNPTMLFVYGSIEGICDAIASAR